MKIIETIRKEKRIKQEVIAAELGIKQSSYSSFITRESDISFSRLLHISNILGVSVIDIIAYPDKYVLESSDKRCDECEEKDKTSQNLNKYIINIGQEIKGELKRQGHSVAWLSRQLGTSRMTCYRIFDSFSVDTQLLRRISILLGRDFFLLYSASLKDESLPGY